MDLRDFSADVQNLTIKMIYVGANMKNEDTKDLRAVFVRDDELSGTMVAAGFFMRQTWEMLGTLICQTTELDDAGRPRRMLHDANGRQFAAFTAKAHVRRRARCA